MECGAAASQLRLAEAAVASLGPAARLMSLGGREAVQTQSLGRVQMRTSRHRGTGIVAPIRVIVIVAPRSR